MSTAADTDVMVDKLIDQLYEIEGKAEIVDGRIVLMSPTGDLPNSAALAISTSLRSYAKLRGGRAYGDNTAFLVNLPNRKSFCPDAAYFTGARTGMKFLRGAPDFAVEVRSEYDYGSTAERRMQEKRADYFAAGTKAIWDVDLDSAEVVRVYRADRPLELEIFHRNEVANAEPAVAGWTFLVDELYD